MNSIRPFITFLTLISFTACSTLPISEDLQKSIIRGAKDKFFANRSRENVEDWKSLQDRNLTRYVAGVGEKLRSFAGVPSLEYAVIDTPVIQAVSSYTASTIYVTLGMLETIQSEAELACLLGHEIHHQEQFLKNPNDEKPHSFAKDIYDYAAPDAVRGFGISQDLEDISYSTHSKSKETDADEQGSALCGKAGYSPYALSDLQKRIASQIKNSPIDTLKNLKGTHDELKDRSDHLRKWLGRQGIKESQGRLGLNEYVKAFQKLKSGSLSAAHRTTLQSLSQIGKSVERLESTGETATSVEISKLTSQLSKIVQREKVTPNELVKLSASKLPGDRFMQERVLSPFSGYGNYHNQVASQILGILEGIGRIALGFTPLGAVIDFHDVVTGKDFFTGEKLSMAQRVLSGVGLVIGQGQNFRKLEGLFDGASVEARALLRTSQKITEVEVKPILGSRYIRDLPDLHGSEMEAFEGHIFRGEMKPGEVVYQAQRTGQAQPGRWFTPVKPLNAEHAEEMLNIKKWENDAGRIKAYRFKESVSGYAGKVEGGSGHQFKIPKDVPMEEILEEIPL